jgi:hypothetical protein
VNAAGFPRVSGLPRGRGFARYTGQESADQKLILIAGLPDILLTDYVMLELKLTQHTIPDPQVFEQANGGDIADTHPVSTTFSAPAVVIC